MFMRRRKAQQKLDDLIRAAWAEQEYYVLRPETYLDPIAIAGRAGAAARVTALQDARWELLGELLTPPTAEERLTAYRAATT